MAGNNNTPVFSTGPALGNLPTPDYYLRIKQNIDGLQAGLNHAIALASENRALTSSQIEQLQKAIQAGGANPLNLTALPGILLQPQLSSIPEVTTLPSAGSSADGQLVLYRKVIWRFSKTTRAWTAASTILLLDYSYNLVNYPPANYAPGVLFVATNTGTLYIEEDVVAGGITTPTWVPSLSEMVALPHADRKSSGVLTTTANNSNLSPATWVSGEHFRASMVGQQIWFNNNLYPVVTFNNNNLIVLGANAGNQNNQNYVFEYPSINYPLGGQFYETDRTLLYFANNANGNANVSGNNVSWAGGPLFDVYWKSITINNNNFNIASVAQNGLALVTATPSGNGSNITWSVPRGAWFYALGVYSNNLNAMPADFAIPDTNARFDAKDYYHSYAWNGNVWNWAASDSGSAYIVAGGTSAPLGGSWARCDGSVTTVANNNGSLVSLATPDLTANTFLAGGNYTGNVLGASVPKWETGAKTDNASLATANESAHVHDITSNSGLAVSGISFNPGNSNANLISSNSAYVSDVTSPTGFGSAHNHNITPNPHSHNLSDNNATFKIPSDNNGGLPQHMYLSWWLRR